MSGFLEIWNLENSLKLKSMIGLIIVNNRILAILVLMITIGYQLL